MRKPEAQRVNDFLKSELIIVEQILKPKFLITPSHLLKTSALFAYVFYQPNLLTYHSCVSSALQEFEV